MILRLLSYNIRFGGLGRQAKLAEVIRAVAPDLVVFQEATDPVVIEELAEATGYPLWGSQRGHSIAFISRVALAHHEWHYTPGTKHSFLELALADSESRIFGLHLSAMFSKWSEQRRTREIRALLKSIEKYQQGFHVLIGDFNTLAPGEVLNAQRMPGWIQLLIWLSGRDIQRQTIQVMLDANYVDGFRTLHPTAIGHTFPTWDPHLRLDYVFLPALFAERLVACEVVREPPVVAQASDHFPLLVQLELGNVGAHTPDSPPAAALSLPAAPSLTPAA